MRDAAIAYSKTNPSAASSAFAGIPPATAAAGGAAPAKVSTPAHSVCGCGMCIRKVAAVSGETLLSSPAHSMCGRGRGACASRG